MTEDLFGNEELSRTDKMRKSRRNTTDLTKEAVEYINNTGQFSVLRSNNIPSYRTQKVTKTLNAFDENGDLFVYEYETIEIHHKRANIKEAILDIQIGRAHV